MKLIYLLTISLILSGCATLNSPIERGRIEKYDADGKKIEQIKFLSISRQFSAELGDAKFDSRSVGVLGKIVSDVATAMVSVATRSSLDEN